MSIIEKAVNALGKVADSHKDRQDAVDQTAPTSQEDTVQRAEHGQELVDLQAQDSVRTAGEAGEGTLEDPIVGEGLSNDSGGERVVDIPFKKLRELGMLTPGIPRSAIAEEFRTIKRPLLTNIGSDSGTPSLSHGNLIMVTSALQGDGKTFTSICLALSIASEQDKTVLFVDADTAKAEAGRLLGVPSGSPGLINLLEDSDASYADYILPTNVDKLSVLPAGGVHSHANELLASARMQRLMIEMSEEYPDRVIVFDSPPLLLTTEAGVLANFMGQVIVVVSAGMTPAHAVTQAIEHIGTDKMVAMVLNRARHRGNVYGYNYGYGGESFYGHDSRERQLEPGH